MRKKLFRKSGSSKRKVPFWAANRELHHQPDRERPLLISSSCRNTQKEICTSLLRLLSWLHWCWHDWQTVFLLLMCWLKFTVDISSMLTVCSQNTQTNVHPPRQRPPGEPCLLVLGGWLSVCRLPAELFHSINPNSSGLCTREDLKIRYCLLKPCGVCTRWRWLQWPPEIPQWTLKKRDR